MELKDFILKFHKGDQMKHSPDKIRKAYHSKHGERYKDRDIKQITSTHRLVRPHSVVVAAEKKKELMGNPALHQIHETIILPLEQSNY